MVHKNKILVLTLDAGFGHRKAAQAVSEAIFNKCGDNLECKVLNPLKEEGLSSVIRKTQDSYDDTSRYYRFFYSAAYDTANHYPINLFADQVITQLLVQDLMEVIIEEKPDGIIATFPIFGTAVRRILTRLKLQIPFYMVVTDLDDVHRFWFQPGPDKFFVASNQLKKQAVQNGIDQKKVIVSGIPVDCRIAAEFRDKEEIRRDLGWDPDLPTLIAVGSKRVQNLFDKLVCLDECKIPLQLCIVAGGDDILFNNIISKKWGINVRAYNYVNNIPELLNASDLLLTKAGGMITSEALACGLPMIIIDSIAGQETGNVNYLIENKAAVTICNTDEIKNTILLWLSDEQKILKECAENAMRLGKPGSAYLIAENISRDIQTNLFAGINKTIWNRLQIYPTRPTFW